MVRIKEAVFDAGPFIHLNEIQKINLTQLFLKILKTKEILEECSQIKLILENLNNLFQKELAPKSKDFTKYIIGQYDLDLGEASCIALCKQEKIKLFFTDDLLAREIANNFGFNVHGTIGIILRSYKEKILDQEETKILIESLYNKSSLFFTKDLFDWTINEVNKYKPN